MACVGMTGMLQFFPTKGVLFESERHAIFLELLAVIFDFARLSFDGHKYLSFAPRHTLALEAYLRTTAGSVPFQAMSTLGGNPLFTGNVRR